MAKKKPTPRRKTASKRKRRIEFEVDLNVLAIDSNYEPVTRAAYEYREKHVYPYLESKGFTLVRCQGLLAPDLHCAGSAVEMTSST